MSSAKNVVDLSDDEEKSIQAGIANDPDNPELSDDELVRLRPASELLPPDLFAALTRRRSLDHDPQPADTEEVTIRLDRTVLDHFQATGAGWHSRINDALKKVVGH